MRVTIGILALSIVACSKGGGSASSAAATSGIVPGNAAVVAVLRSPQAFLDQLGKASVFGAFTGEEMKAFKDDLNEFVDERLGLKLDGLRSVTLFVTAEGSVAVLLPDVKGRLKGEKRGEREGTEIIAIEELELVAAQRGSVLIVGMEDAVHAAIDAAAGKRDSLAKGNPKLAELVNREAASAFLTVAGDPSFLPEEEMREAAAERGVKLVLLSMSSKRILARAIGDKAGLGRLKEEIEQGLKMAVMGMEMQMDRATSKDDGELLAGVGMIVGYHMIKHIAATVKPRLDGDQLSLEVPFNIDDPMVMVGMIGMGAAVAIPSFLKYTKKSKSTEAAQGVKKLYDGARMYHMEYGKFPESAGPTPREGSCCMSAGGKCMPDSTTWEHPTWTALRFAMDDPYQYSYTFESSATAFTARATGDLDCDGTYSTFEMAGTIGADGTLQGSAGIYKEKELE